jgi:hypothetical protein
MTAASTIRRTTILLRLASRKQDEWLSPHIGHLRPPIDGGLRQHCFFSSLVERPKATESSTFIHATLLGTALLLYGPLFAGEVESHPCEWNIYGLFFPST